MQMVFVLSAIDWYFPVTFLAGLVIFYNAERLSRYINPQNPYNLQ